MSLNSNPFALNPVKVTEVIVNGYSIDKVDSSSYWGAIKVDEKSGKCFKTKKSAIDFAKAN